MKAIYANQLTAHLKQGHRFFILVGQDPFLLTQSRTQLRTFAQSEGFDDVLKLSLDSQSQFPWDNLFQALSSDSLFGDKQMIEWSWQSPKFDEETLTALEPLLVENVKTLLVIVAGALTKPQQNAKWFKRLSQNACVVSHWPPRAQDMPRWIATAGRERQLNIPNALCLFLSQHYQGQLQAISQLLDKIALTTKGDVTEQHIQAHLETAHAKDVFVLQSALLQQDKNKVLSVLSSLKVNKTELSLVLWCVHRLLESLFLAKQNAPSEPWLRARGIWAQDQAVFRRMMQKTSTDLLRHLLGQTHSLDRLAKTGDTAHCWQSIAQICLQSIGAMPHMHR